MRKVRYFLGSFRVLVPVDRNLSLDELYRTLQVVSETFRDAQEEYIRDAKVFDSPIQPHVFVSQIRPGSLDLQVIYQALIALPWQEIAHVGREVAYQGVHVIERIGAIAAGIETMRQIGPWIKGRLSGVTESKDRDSGSPVTVIQESSLRTDLHGFSNSNIAIETARDLLHDPIPRAVLVLLDGKTTTSIRRVLNVSIEERKSYLGGKTIIHDMNLIMNGLSSLEEMRKGDPFCFHNPGAMGLQVIPRKDSLFEACARPGSSLKLNDVSLDAMEFPEELDIVEGRSIDIDDLPSST